MSKGEAIATVFMLIVIIALLKQSINLAALAIASPLLRPLSLHPSFPHSSTSRTTRYAIVKLSTVLAHCTNLIRSLHKMAF
jgi:hypothetical protein